MVEEMKMPNKIKKSELVTQAMNVVYTDWEKYLRDIAREHTIANMGQDLESLMQGCREVPEHVISDAFNQLRNDCESDEMADGVDEEFRSWLKQAKKDAAVVKKLGLPWTIDNSRLVFEKKIGR